MVEKYGNYEVNFSEGWVRLHITGNDYEYIVHPNQFDGSIDKSIRVCRVFQTGYNVARMETKNLLRSLIE